MTVVAINGVPFRIPEAWTRWIAVLNPGELIPERRTFARRADGVWVLFGTSWRRVTDIYEVTVR